MDRRSLEAGTPIVRAAIEVTAMRRAVPWIAARLRLSGGG